ncbi:MAG: cupin domain-containing protein [Phycisphaerales bacterium]|nr:cupin domain-containing protein [Phycisphaerales bacterium]
MSSSDRINLANALDCFDDHWSPRIIAELNGQQIKLAKFIGAFDWHSHADEDEMFLVLEGSFVMEFRDKRVELKAGEMLVVPRGVEHRPVAEEECSVMLVEPVGLVNTGDAETSEKTTTGIWLKLDS